MEPKKQPLRIASWVLGGLSILCLALWGGARLLLRFAWGQQGGVGIIGGADGPTAIFLATGGWAGLLGNPLFLGLILGLGAVLCRLAMKHRRKKE